jgi:hypothetical protein
MYRKISNNVNPVNGCTNVLATNYDAYATTNDGTCEFTSANIVAIINDGYPEHAANMLEIFETEYGNPATLFNNQDADLFEYAEAIGCDVLIKSYPLLYSYIPLAEQYYPQVQMFMPLGSNASVELQYPETLSVIISCGATNDVGGVNETGYGMGLEFFDLENYFNPVDESSYTNPIIAAKIMQIKDARECTFWEARYCARFTATRTIATHPSGEIWNKFNGFGVINVANAIAYNGSIPADPFLNNGNVYTPFIP